MDTNTVTFDAKLRKYAGAPGFSGRARDNYNKVRDMDKNVGYKGNIKNVENWRERAKIEKRNILIEGKELEDKLLREEDIWLLRNALCSHTWKLTIPEIVLEWTSYCERQSSGDNSKKSIIRDVTQRLPLAYKGQRRIRLVLRSLEVQPTAGLIKGSITGREAGANMHMLTVLAPTIIPTGLSDNEVQSIRSIESMGHNYEELFCKMYLILLQNLMYHRVEGAVMLGDNIQLVINAHNMMQIEDACGASNCVISMGSMGASIVQLIHRASLQWPSQAVRFSDDTYFIYLSYIIEYFNRYTRLTRPSEYEVRQGE